MFKQDATVTSTLDEINEVSHGFVEGAGNDKLLGIYGFVEEDNPNERIPSSWDKAKSCKCS